MVFTLSLYANSIGDKAMKDVPASAGFKYYSGNTEILNRHPAIYVFKQNGEEIIVVVGREWYEEFSIKDFSRAVKNYRRLLLISGYSPEN